MSIVSLEPIFIIQEPKEDNYKFVIRAINEKGPSQIVEILKENIINVTLGKNTCLFTNSATGRWFTSIFVVQTREIYLILTLMLFIQIIKYHNT